VTRTLQDAAHAAAACTRCELAEGRTTVVYGSGHPDAELMFIGEAPGFHEDRQGVPFVGAAGNLLTELLSGIGLARDQVYIANTLKCRPPGNRDPKPEEIEACHPWLLEQIDIVDPLVICTLGNFATRLLLSTTVGISRMRGQEFSYRDRLLIPTFHPAAILHSGGRTSTSWGQMEEDFRLVAKRLEELRGARADSRDEEAEQLGLF